jgi:hypothetical protein
MSFFLLRFIHSDSVDTDPKAGEADAQPRRRPGRWFLRKELSVSFVHCVEVGRIREKDRRPDDGTHLQAEFLEDGLDIQKALTRLAPDVRRDPFTRLPARKERSLAGDEHETVGDDAMRVRADRLGMVRQCGNSSHVSTAAGLADVPKGLCAELADLRK